MPDYYTLAREWLGKQSEHYGTESCGCEPCRKRVDSLAAKFREVEREAREQERERCARIATVNCGPDTGCRSKDIASAIRAQGDK